jgi:hypothetical protein
VVDANGPPLNFTLSNANGHDHRKLLETIAGIKIGKRGRRPQRLGLDNGYASEPRRRERRNRGIVPNAKYGNNRVTLPNGRPPKEKRERRYCRQRGKVERNLAWLNTGDRWDRFLEASQKAYRAFMRVYFIRHDLRLLF